MDGFDTYNPDYLRSLYEALGMARPDSGGITRKGMLDAWKVYGDKGATSDSGLINHVRKTVKVDAYGNPVYPSTFPARPEVPFQNNTRLAGRLPSIPLNIDGATGVAASDWFSQPGTYVGSSLLPDGRMSVADLPALNTPKAMPTDPMTIEAQRVAKDWIDNPRDFKGRDTAAAVLGTYGGSNDVSAKRKPGYKLGDGALAFLTQNNKQPINGLSGLLASLFQQPSTAVATKLDTRGPSPADRYATSNAVAQLNAILQPRTGNAGGYSYANGQKTGYAPIDLGGGVSAIPTSGAQAYQVANVAAKGRAIANSAEPSKAAARASLASQWGFD